MLEKCGIFEEKSFLIFVWRHLWYARVTLEGTDTTSYSLRVFPSFYAQNPSQPQKEKSFPKFVMHQILLQFFHKTAVETLFLYQVKQPADQSCGKIVEKL
jgi:hypothetical protein